ncbi:MAG: hypothetical protein ABUS56_04520 [Acidobacteriota bacterium]
MGAERRRVFVLAALALVLVGVLYQTWTTSSTAVAPTRARTPTATGRRGPEVPESGAIAAPDVHLDVLDAEHPPLEDSERNLFRFKAPPPVRVVRVAPPPAPAPVLPVPSGPPVEPPPPPIPLKFIGVVQAPDGSARIAALIDALGRPYHSAEGEVVAGQYRVLKILPESIEMSYLDGRGRQIIRLSGS